MAESKSPDKTSTHSSPSKSEKENVQLNINEDANKQLVFQLQAKLDKVKLGGGQKNRQTQI